MLKKSSNGRYQFCPKIKTKIKTNNNILDKRTTRRPVYVISTQSHYQQHQQLIINSIQHNSFFRGATVTKTTLYISCLESDRACLVIQPIPKLCRLLALLFKLERRFFRYYVCSIFRRNFTEKDSFNTNRTIITAKSHYVSEALIILLTYKVRQQRIKNHITFLFRNDSLIITI